MPPAAHSELLPPGPVGGGGRLASALSRGLALRTRTETARVIVNPGIMIVPVNLPVGKVMLRFRSPAAQAGCRPLALTGTGTQAETACLSCRGGSLIDSEKPVAALLLEYHIQLEFERHGKSS